MGLPSSPPDVAVSTLIACPPREAWLAVADPRTVADLSPELQAVALSATPPLAVGTTFRGTNRRGGRTWSTTCRVVESRPAAAFAYDVTYLGLAVARWRYAIEPEADGCRVEEQWWDHRGLLMRAVGEWGTGVRDRPAHNRTSMTATLDRLQALLEVSGQLPPEHHR